MGEPEKKNIGTAKLKQKEETKVKDWKDYSTRRSLLRHATTWGKKQGGMCETGGL